MQFSHIVNIYRPEQSVGSLGQTIETERLVATAQARVIQRWTVSEDDQLVRAETDEERVRWQVIMMPLDVEIKTRDRVKVQRGVFDEDDNPPKVYHVQSVYESARVLNLWCEEYKIKRGT